MGTTGIKVKALAELDFDVHEDLRKEIKLKRLQGSGEETKEEALGKMIEERSQLQKAINKKGWTFEELINFLTRK